MHVKIICPYCNSQFMLTTEAYDSYSRGVALGGKGVERDGAVIIDCGKCREHIKLLIKDGKVIYALKEGEKATSEMRKFRGEEPEKRAFENGKRIDFGEFNLSPFLYEFSVKKEVLLSAALSIVFMITLFFMVYDFSKIEKKSIKVLDTTVETVKSSYEKVVSSGENVTIEKERTEKIRINILKTAQDNVKKFNLKVKERQKALEELGKEIK